MYLTIGSGDISALLSGQDTQAYRKLWEKFLSPEPPNYNALASTIDAFRTGAILEERYFGILPGNYFYQVKVTNKEFDCHKATLDNALILDNKITGFDELKSVNLDDYLLIEKYRDSAHYTDFIKKRYKKYYNQVQDQLFTTGLEAANLVFLVVYSYNDSDNYNRIIKHNEYIKFPIVRDEKVINEIRKRLIPFQQVKTIIQNNYGIRNK